MKIFAHVIVFVFCVFCPRRLLSLYSMADSNAGCCTCVWSQPHKKRVCLFACLFVCIRGNLRIWCARISPKKRERPFVLYCFVCHWSSLCSVKEALWRHFKWCSNFWKKQLHVCNIYASPSHLACVYIDCTDHLKHIIFIWTSGKLFLWVQKWEKSCVVFVLYC